MVFKNNKAQGLPLNTIVIALLVIIVLVVIIVFFSSSMIKNQDQINNLAGCSDANSALGVAGWKDIESSDDNCPSGKTQIKLVPTSSKKDTNGVVTSVTLCCGVKK